MEIVYDQNELKRTSAKPLSHRRTIRSSSTSTWSAVKWKSMPFPMATDVYIPGIMEQIERAGVHSGDSIAVYPPQHLGRDIIETLIRLHSEQLQEP